ncbi:MAG: hypothetical protein IIZ61_02435 [Lachnospiraceae bacterium]|nr:hypothetical protein [Lachnospiraceae bacterium]
MKAEKRNKKNDKKKNILFWILLTIGILAVATTIGVLIYNAVKNRKTDETFDETYTYAGEPTKPSVEYGDAESDTIDFSGEYFDRAGEKTSLSIIRGDEDGSYSVSIFTQEDDYTSYSWEIDASYDGDSKALLYEGGTCIRYFTDPSDSDGEPEAFVLYENGSGKIFSHDDSLLWLDDVDDKGSGMLFTRRTAE